MKASLYGRFWVLLILILFIPATVIAQDAPGECVEMGAMAYDNWTKEDSGGTGTLPDGAENSNYVRCKACHGWDHMATDGGYVRRERNEGQTNAGAGDGDMTSRNISMMAREGAMVTAEMVWHEGTGRAYSDGKGSWVELMGGMGMHSSQNKADHSSGYTLGNQHPDFSTGGMTQAQVDCLAAFLNFADADPKAYFSNINPGQDPALYTMVGTADAVAGEAYYGANCAGCHSADPADESGFDPGGGMLAYLAKDGKFSEFSHKVRWGIPDASMTREAMGSPTSADVANVMLWLQEEGETGFAANSGLTGTWWNSARDGEGFVLDFGKANDILKLFGSFYTFDDMGDQVWLTAESTAISGAEVTVNVFITDGPMWGDAFDTADKNTMPWGTGTFTFPSCTSGSVSLVPNAEMMAMGFTEYTQTLTRDAIESGIACPTPNAN